MDSVADVERSEREVQPLQKYELKEFAVKTYALVERHFVLLLVSYCCDNSEGNDMPALGRDVAVKRQLVRCMVSGDDICSGVMSIESSVEGTQMIRKPFSEISTEQYSRRPDRK